MDFTEIFENIDGFNLICIKNDTVITTYLKEEKKIWEDWLEKYIKELYVENTNMIDIGAHIGTFSLMMSKYISENSHIYSFEPVYNKILIKNIENNNLLDKINIYPVGLSNVREQLQGGFIDFNIKSNYGFTQIDKLPKVNENSQFIINVDKLDNYNIENVSFIKIDVEGSERKVLEGSIETIIKYTPTILIEIWCTSKNSLKNYINNDNNILESKNALKCFEFLFNLGYICFPVSPNSDDFLFIHYKKKEIIQKIIDIL
jgi:FkbM family methyltransferase